MRSLPCRALNWYFEVGDADTLHRLVVYPNAYKKKAFSSDLLWRIDHVEGTDDVFETSLAWARLVPSSPEVHAYGCRLAEKMNVEKAQERGHALKEKDRRVYCGAYQIGALSVRKLPTSTGASEVLEAEVVHKPEDGEIAHVALYVRIAVTGADIQNVKTIILDRLWRASSGPMTHKCECDAALKDHPSGALKDGPTVARSSDDSKIRRRMAALRAVLDRHLLTTLDQAGLSDCQGKRLARWVPHAPDSGQACNSTGAGDK